MVEKRTELVLSPNAELLKQSGTDALLSSIRPEWQAKDLIARVKRILPIDPSSACQRLFNASIHDLKSKLMVAGFDIVSEAAKGGGLPAAVRPEDIERYTPYNTIELAHLVGILSRAEAKRLFRVYDIRGDLEHEDDQYEATIEDCIYVFKTCIDCVLSKDPIQVIRLTDIKDVVEQPSAVTLDEAVIDDYEHAPPVRQLDIYRFLVSTALNAKQPDVVRQNCWLVLHLLRPVTQNGVLVQASQLLTEKIGRNPADLLHMRVAFASGVLPYLKKTQVAGFFKSIHSQMESVGYSFRGHSSHRELLGNLRDVGGLVHCPEDMLFPITEWLVLCYIGETGGYGQGRSRNVFYSNVGAPMAFDLIRDHAQIIRDTFKKVDDESKRVKREISDPNVARRLDSLRDLFPS